METHLTSRFAPLLAARTGQQQALRRIAIIGPSSEQIVMLRGSLIGRLTSDRHAVACYATAFDERDAKRLDALGVERRALPKAPPGLTLFPQRRFITDLAHDIASWRPHTVIAFGAALTLAAVKAARKGKAERIVAMINDLPGGTNTVDLRAISRTLELADVAVFHNTDDPKTLHRAKALPADLPFVIVPGAGVDLEAHALQPLPPLTAGLVFLMIARLDQTKGVLDFCEAARICKSRAPSATFQLAGPAGSGKTALTASVIESYRDCVNYVGPLEDVRPALCACHVYVYPSHAEGMPRSVLEAMAAGRPIITTNVAGCRETVDERINGCLVPPADPHALAVAMESFLKRPDLIPSLARASRAKAERRFDEKAVIETLIGVLGV